MRQSEITDSLAAKAEVLAERFPDGAAIEILNAEHS